MLEQRRRFISEGYTGRAWDPDCEGGARPLEERVHEDALSIVTLLRKAGRERRSRAAESLPP